MCLKKYQKIMLLLFIYTVFPGITKLTANDSAETTENVTEQNLSNISAAEIALLWTNENCHGLETYKKQSRSVVVGCESDFSEKERSILLDYLFRRGMQFVSEKATYPSQNSAIYDFTFQTIQEESERKLLYVKILISSEEHLYGQPPIKADIGILVEGATQAKQITEWNTTGIRLSFAFKPLENTAELVSTAGKYKQEAWLHIPLSSNAISEVGSISEGDTLNSKANLSAYIANTIKQGGESAGVFIADKNEITENVETARIIVQSIKDNGHSLLIVPAYPTYVLRTSANMMSLPAQSGVKVPDGKCILPSIKSMLKKKQMILRISAKNTSCLKKIRAEKNTYKSAGIRFKYSGDFFPEEKPKKE